MTEKDFEPVLTMPPLGMDSAQLQYLRSASREAESPHRFLGLPKPTKQSPSPAPLKSTKPTFANTD